MSSGQKDSKVSPKLPSKRKKNKKKLPLIPGGGGAKKEAQLPLHEKEIVGHHRRQSFFTDLKSARVMRKEEDNNGNESLDEDTEDDNASRSSFENRENGRERYGRRRHQGSGRRASGDEDQISSVMPTIKESQRRSQSQRNNAAVSDDKTPVSARKAPPKPYVKHDPARVPVVMRGGATNEQRATELLRWLQSLNALTAADKKRLNKKPLTTTWRREFASGFLFSEVLYAHTKNIKGAESKTLHAGVRKGMSGSIKKHNWEVILQFCSQKCINLPIFNCEITDVLAVRGESLIILMERLFHWLSQKNLCKFRLDKSILDMRDD